MLYPWAENWNCWQLAHGCFWGHFDIEIRFQGVDWDQILRIPEEDLPYYAPDFKDRRGALAKKYPTEYKGIDVKLDDQAFLRWEFFRNWWNIEGASSEAYDQVKLIGGFTYPKNVVNTAIVPRDAAELLCFVRSGSEVTIWHGKGKRLKRQKKQPALIGIRMTGYWETKWTKGSALPAHFREPFCAYVEKRSSPDGYEKNDYFFVTKSGALFVAEEENFLWSMRCLWGNAIPLRAVITDTASKRTFLFAHLDAVRGLKDAKETGVFFQLGKTVRLNHFTSPRLQRWKGNLERVEEYIRILADQKKVTIKQ